MCYVVLHAFLFIRIVFFRFNMDILNVWANIILVYSWHILSTVATLREDLILVILIEYILKGKLV